MAKYAVYTKWRWPNGVASPDQMQGWHRELKAEGTNVEEIIWWKMDDNHHQSVIVYPSQAAAQADIKNVRKTAIKALKRKGLNSSKKRWGRSIHNLQQFNFISWQTHPRSENNTSKRQTAPSLSWRLKTDIHTPLYKRGWMSVLVGSLDLHQPKQEIGLFQSSTKNCNDG